jgi:hypothetical protein
MPKKTDKKQNKSKKLEDSHPHLLTFGELDLIFKIEFKKDDLEKSESSDKETSNNETEYYKLEDLNELKDLKFLQDNEELWDKIQLKPGNESLKVLLIGNKNLKKKCEVEYICFGFPKFEGDEEFFEEIFDHVTTKNGLNINKTPLDEGARYSIKIEMKYGKETKTIVFGKTEEEENKEKEEENKDNDQEDKDKNKEKDEENKKKEKKEKNEDGNENGQGQGQGGEEEEEEEDDYEENDAMLDKRIPKFKRSKSVLCNLDPSSTRYDMIYLNYDDFSKIPGDFKMEDMIELLTFFKKKNSSIFINYYKKEKTPPQEEETSKQDKQNPKNNKKDTENENKEGEEKKEENKEEKKEEEKKGEEKKEEEKKGEEKKEEEKKEEEKKEEEKDNKDEKKEEKKENKKTQPKKEEKQQQDNKNKTKNQKNKNKGPSKEMQLLNKIYYITDFYFFDTEQAVKLFDAHYKSFTEEEPKKNINKSKLYDYFIKGIATGTEEEVHGDKAGLFLDEFNKFFIVRASKKAANKREYDSQPFPKINHKNLKLVTDYKNIIKKNKNDCYSLFLSNIIISMAASAPKCLSAEIIYPSYLVGIELVKRKIECIKNKLPIPNDENFYKVKINMKALAKELEKFEDDNKEGGFILDCTNKSKSKLKEYVSLYDYHLKGFFSSQKVRKNLKDKGFINSKGFIMYDPVYRSVMGAKAKNKKKISENEMKSKLMSSIKGIDVPSRIKDKELDSKKVVLGQNTATNKKIPFIKEPPRPNKKKMPTKEESESSGSSEEESGTGSGAGSSEKGENSGSGGSGSGDGSGSGSGDGSGSGSGSES